jgi:hypothetical protein
MGYPWYTTMFYAFHSLIQNFTDPDAVLNCIF